MEPNATQATPDKRKPQDLGQPSIGRYQVLRQLGQGAMGRVLLAHDPVLDRDVAVKLLRDDLKLPSEQRRALLDRMRHEARASARVCHPNIVAMHDMGETANFDLYLVFEYAEGITLKDKLLRGPLGAEAGARIAREIGGALTALHEAGVLHRDIKPENIILTKNGSKIADFGIARVPDSTLTRDGGLLGTPAYSSPESISTGGFSPLSDQFSMATTLYEALSGRRAFPGEDAVAVATRITTERAPPIARLSGLDEQVDQVLYKAMSKTPHHRYESAAEFGNALAEALELRPRGSLATLPDEFHARLNAPVPIAPKHGRYLALGLVLGVMVGVVGWLSTDYLSNMQRSETAAGLVPPVKRRVPSPPIGYLSAPISRPKPKFSVNHQSEERRARPTSDAGIEPGAFQDAGLTEGQLHEPDRVPSESSSLEPEPRQPR